ncbi:hypothetical protein WOLCODRAFT_164462 [Wolfiporia cocos MD-104 SS10]|uniref:Zn(2)-C6 fungal-type domain-containing protein n=1 Tax=Wolfiporia cocos (strain MD-104) TaxID=742152 RepID=A0A2H3K021_WOLCO|nr:hypothetical protein WOLCODRAFT_164462 [Wolfiporia cocos MD-104 SS10]
MPSAFPPPIQSSDATNSAMSPTAQERQSEHSEDEGPSQGDGAQGGTSQSPNVKRNARACDRCRKSKSKCEPAPNGGDQCKGCVAAKTECTFSGPSFRRGPPKGYIQALEHRLHQMESMLAAIMSSQDLRAKGIVADLRRDNLAKSILDGVDSGPFGLTGRQQRSIDPTQDNFFASIVKESALKQMSERSRRQSRMTRESVTQHVIDPVTLGRPTLEWQDRLSESLARWAEQPTNAAQAGTPTAVPVPPALQGRAATGSSSSLEPARQRRRTDHRDDMADLRWDDVHVMNDTDLDELDDCADAFGNLSIDENKEVRYHGNSSGLQFLARDNRWDKRNIGGIWNFPMSNIWPGVPLTSVDREKKFLELGIPMPPREVQTHLLERFFTYVNPVFPVVDKEAFMQQYNALREPGNPREDQVDAGDPSQTMRPAKMQQVSRLLLFAMFAFAAKYSDLEAHLSQDGTQWHTGRIYATQARKVLGMAMRMALDLGMNRNSDQWQHKGKTLFTPAQTRIRRQIWWACCLADKYSAQFLGRPMETHESDFSTPLPDVPEDDADDIWAPLNTTPAGRSIPPALGRSAAYLRAAAALSVIHGEVVEKIYPVTRVSTIPRRRLMEQIHTRLTQWCLNLPESLQYSSVSKRPCPPPHVLVLHCHYCAIMLLLHRPFIPKRFDAQTSPSSPSTTDPVPWKSLDLCQGAASQIAAFATLYHEKYDLRWGPPFLVTYLQSAGIMHIITLKFRPTDPQATLGLRDCIMALQNMKNIWPSAARVGDLLRGASVQFDIGLSPSVGSTRKRPAEIAFDGDPVVVDPQHYTRAEIQQPFDQTQQSLPQTSAEQFLLDPLAQAFAGEEDLSNMSFQNLIGPPTSLIDPSTTVAPGYDWWPILSSAENVPLPDTQDDYDIFGTLPSQPFTFSHQHFAPEFLQGTRNPILHFPSVYHTR